MVCPVKSHSSSPSCASSQYTVPKPVDQVCIDPSLHPSNSSTLPPNLGVQLIKDRESLVSQREGSYSFGYASAPNSTPAPAPLPYRLTTNTNQRMVETGWCTSLDRHRHKETGYVIGGERTRAIIIQDGSQPGPYAAVSWPSGYCCCCCNCCYNKYKYLID